MTNSTMEFVELDKDRIDLYRKPRYKLFKTLYSTACRMDCKYCPLSNYCRFTRETWDPGKLVETFLNSYKAGRVEGFFLSSTLFSDPEVVVEKELYIVEKLRRRGYKGYIHLRLMPGTPKDQVFHAAVLADRVGVNIESPRRIFSDIAPSKGDWLNDIIKRIEWLVFLKNKFRKQRPPHGYLSSGVDTQIMAGVLDETDLEILETIWHVLKIGVDRVYVSGFKPYKQTPFEKRKPISRQRYLRIVKAVELMRVYGFSIDDIKTIVDEHGMLKPGDPKTVYAETNKHLYPIDINNDPYEKLLLVPGIGPRTAKRILALRMVKKIKKDDLLTIMGWKRFKKASKYITL